MKAKLVHSGKILLSVLLMAAMVLPTAFLESLAVSADSIEQDKTDKMPISSSAAVSKAPRIRYYVPYDSWQRDFTMSESTNYYYCTINSAVAQVYVYDKSSGDFSNYAGLTSSADKNINVEFENIDGKTYKNVKISQSPFAGKEIEIRVEKSSGIVYGVSGTAGSSSPVFSSAPQIRAKTAAGSDFAVYDMTVDSNNSDLYTYSFMASSVEMSFLYNGTSADSLLSYQTEESQNKGVALVKNSTGDTYTASLLDTENCDKIIVSVDKYTGNVFAEAAKSDVAPENNKVFYLEGRFICKDSSNNTVSVNNTSWSTSSTNIAFSKTEQENVYNFVTNSTIAELTAPSGSPYYFLVREGTNYPRSASGKYYAPSANTVLTNTKPGEHIAVTYGTNCGGGICFNDKNAAAGKVTLWLDNSDPSSPFMYYTLRYGGFSAKAMSSNGTSQYVDYAGSTPTVTPNNVVELPQGAEVSAAASVVENDKEYGFIEWTTANGTGSFENAANAQTTFYPTADNEQVIAHYKVIYSLVCSQTEHGTIEASNSKYGVGESYTIDVTPDEGYVLSSLTVNGEEKFGEMTDKSQYTGVMPDSSVTVNAVFEQKKDVFFYAAVASNWGEAARNINVVADGVKLSPVAVFDTECTLYKLNDTNRFSSKTFYVRMYKAEQNAAVIIGEPEHDGGVIDENCYGYKIAAGELKAGACYSYYSFGVGQNTTVLIEAMNIKSVTCLTAEPTKDSPVQFSYTKEDCNGKTAGQESYTIVTEVKDQNGNTYPVANNQFVPTTAGKYTISVWAAFGSVGATSNIAQCEVIVPGDEPVNTELEVEFKYYQRDLDKHTEMSNSEQSVSVTQEISENGMAETVFNAYESVSKKLPKYMNLMSEYSFYMSQAKALQGIKSQTNYHSLKTDGENNIERNTYGIAQYKTYGECYNDSVLQYHTDGYGNVGSSEKWVQYFADTEEISETDAYANPNSVTKVIVHGFNNPRIYHAGLSFADENGIYSAEVLDNNKSLYMVGNTEISVYDVFYNMSLSADTDYSESGYLSNFALDSYYGKEQMPTAVSSFTDEAGVKYVFDGWYDSSLVKVSADRSYTGRVTNNIALTAVYKKADSSSNPVPTVTVTQNDTEKYRVSENGVEIEKIKINTVMNAFDCNDISNAAVIYVRLKSTETTDWANNYPQIDITSLKQEIKNLLDSETASTGRNIKVIVVGTDGKAQIIADNFDVVSDEADVDVQNFKIMLNNKNRVQFSNSFTAQSACENGANAAILTFAAVKNNGEWIVSENYIPYMNVG